MVVQENHAVIRGAHKIAVFMVKDNVWKNVWVSVRTCALSNWSHVPQGNFIGKLLTYYAQLITNNSRAIIDTIE